MSGVCKDRIVFIEFAKKLIHGACVKKLVKEGEIKKVIELVKKLIRVRELLPDPVLVEMLVEKFYCSNCLKNPISLLTDCSHHLCYECLIWIELDPIESEISCKICQSPLSLLNPAPGFKECTICNKYFPSKYFKDTNSCHPRCNFCLLSLSKRIFPKCQICASQVDFDFSSMVQCYRCESSIQFKNSIFLCNIHSYCYECGLLGLEKKKCCECGLSIPEANILKIKSSIIYKCSVCQIPKFKDLIVEKACCSFFVCVACQFNASQVLCIKCGSIII